jgi:hypothetical protein
MVPLPETVWKIVFPEYLAAMLCEEMWFYLQNLLMKN